MLLLFSVQNFACFAEEALFSMVASSDASQPQHVVESEAGRKPRILRLAALYGANGHGKSKIVEALRFVRDLVVDGTKAGDPIECPTFRLDSDLSEAASRFEIVIDYDGVEYSYGFVVDEKRVLEEWLFARLTSRESRFFERITDDDGKVTVEFGPALGGGSKKERQLLEFVAEGTRPDQLFLTEALDRNVGQVKPMLEWFRRVLVIVSADDAPQAVAIRAGRDQSLTDFLADFLSRAGTGVDGVKVEETPVDGDGFFGGAPTSFLKSLSETVDKGHVFNFVDQTKNEVITVYKNSDGERVVGRLKTIHRSKNGGSVEFQFGDESSGTQRLMEIMPILADAESRERVYVVDELDRKLHPALSRLFVETFIQRCRRQPHTAYLHHPRHPPDGPGPVAPP
jgi:AAA15 family ATPase/GTPase